MSSEPSTPTSFTCFSLLKHKSALGLILFATLPLACSGSDSPPGGGGGTASVVQSGGAASSGGSSSTATGGAHNTGGNSAATGGTSASTTGGAAGETGGNSAATGGTKASTGGNSPKTGGAPATGGNSPKTGGAPATGGSTHGVGGASSTGGALGSGGTNAVGGMSAKTGGAPSTGGSANAGGTVSTGGSAPIGGASAIGGTSSLAGGSSGAFKPCPSDGTVCKILPLGDSITYGLQSADGGGYREPLFKKTLNANQKITFTGSQKNGPNTVQGPNGSVTFPRNNEGNSGFTIDQIAGTVPAAMNTGIPHIVLLMAGTNDVYASSGQSTMPDRLKTLIDKVATAAPNALIVVAQLTPLSNASWQSTLTTYNGKIAGVVQTEVTAGKHVIEVDMSKMPVSDLSDGVHPNDTGYSYMADIWYAAIKDLLPQ